VPRGPFSSPRPRAIGDTQRKGMQMNFKSTRFADDQALAAAAKNNPAICKGAKGPAIEAIQAALVDLGYAMPISTAGPGSTPDGIFGNETAATVKTFQKELQLDVDGIVGRQTMMALDEVSAFADLRPLRDSVDDIDSAVDNFGRTLNSTGPLGDSDFDELRHKTSSMKATMLLYEPNLHLPPSRMGQIWLTNVSPSGGSKWAGAGVGANPLGAAIALLLIAILSMWRPTKVGPRYGRGKPSKASHPVPVPPAAILIPVVTAWELLSFAEAVTTVTAAEVWRQIKYKDDYDRLRDCKDRNTHHSSECAEAWKTFDKIRNQLLQRLNSIQTGKQSMYPNLVKAANDLYLGGKDGIGYLKALAAVKKCFDCAGP